MKKPRLEIKLDGQVFWSSFANVDDVLNNEIWKVATVTLHEVIKGHFQK